MDNLWQKVENIVTKGEIARFVQFLLLSLCFQKTSAAYASECVCKWERVNPFPHADAFRCNSSRRLLKTLWPNMKLLMMSNYLWPQCFQLYLTIKLSFMENFQVFVTIFSKLSAADLLSHMQMHFDTFSWWRLKNIVLINPFPPVDACWRIYCKRLLKTLWQKLFPVIISRRAKARDFYF